MSNIEEALQDAAARFVESTKEYIHVELDGSLQSLAQVQKAMQQYHLVYKRGLERKEAGLAPYVEQLASTAAAYDCRVLIKNLGVKLAASNEGKLQFIVHDSRVAIEDLMEEQLKTGQPLLISLLKQLLEMGSKTEPPREIDSGNVESETRAAAAVAVKDIRAALKQELDYSLESLTLVDRALQRLKGVAETSPESKSNLVKASCDKYGSYIGEVLVRQFGGRWVRLQVRESTVNAVAVGSLYAVPAHIVRAVLEGKALKMGTDAATTVTHFAKIVGQGSAPETGAASNRLN